MSKASRAKSKDRRLNEKRKRKAAMRALYESYKAQGKTKVKRKARKLRDYDQGPRPRQWPAGTKPAATRRSTKEKQPWYGEYKMERAEEKRVRRALRQQEQ